MAICENPLCRAEVSDQRAFVGARYRDGSPAALFCGDKCAHEAARAMVYGQDKCLCCSRTFPSSRDGAGRPRLFHDESCRRNHGKAVQRALRALTKGKNGVPSARGDTAAEVGAGIRRLEEFDADLVVLAAKLRREGDDATLAPIINGLRTVVSDRVYRAKLDFAMRAEAEKEDRRLAGEASAIGAKRARRIAAGQEAVAAAIARFSGKGT